MKLFKISQDAKSKWDTFDSAVVAANTAEDARHIHPGAAHGNWWEDGYSLDDGAERAYVQATWVMPDAVKVEYIGIARDDSKRGVICASFNAG